jgi:Protein of unknown function (DUF1579)
MRLTRAALALTIGALMLVAPSAALEAKKTPDAVFASQAMPPAPKPGPEHQILKQDEGTWDATVEIFAAPGTPPLTSKGVETNIVGCGGLCLITDFKGEMMPGQPFHGHGTTAYNPAKKKYVGSWTDSMSTGLLVGESTYDAAAKSATGWMEGPDMTAQVTKMKSVVDYKDADTRVFSMYGPGPDGKEALSMRMTLKRRK